MKPCAMAARGDEGGVQPAAAHGAIEGRLADAEEPRRLAGRDQPSAFRLVLQLLRERLDISLAEAPVAARSDESRPEKTPGHGPGDCRLADAQAGCHILRTDQSVQDVVLGLTNPYQKAVGELHFFEVRPWNFTRGAGISSLKMCRYRQVDPRNSCQTFHCAFGRGPSERNSELIFS